MPPWEPLAGGSNLTKAYPLGPALTITIEGKQISDHRTNLALAALGWVLSDGQRAQRFLDLTGLTPDQLRAGLEDDAVLGSVFDFLSAHEPDLVAAAESLGVAPQELTAAAKDAAR